MKYNLFEINERLQNGEITSEQSHKELLILHGVVCSSCEDIPKESYYPGMTCKECNQPFRIVKNKQ